MKLRYSATSPFVRKVVVVAKETGLLDRLELIKTATLVPNAELTHDNPLQKVPALQLESGDSLFDSAVICEYLDSLHDGVKMFPASGPDRWTALRRQALGDGMCDASILRRYESIRPAELQSAAWDAAQKLKVDQGLAALEAEVGRFGSRIDIGTLTIAIMLDYLNFRFAHENWTQRFPALAAWHRQIMQRPSLASTTPRD
jgi:glutathione S-transferase